MMSWQWDKNKTYKYIFIRSIRTKLFRALPPPKSPPNGCKLISAAPEAYLKNCYLSIRTLNNMIVVKTFKHYEISIYQFQATIYFLSRGIKQQKTFSMTIISSKRFLRMMMILILRIRTMNRSHDEILCERKIQHSNFFCFFMLLYVL